MADTYAAVGRVRTVAGWYVFVATAVFMSFMFSLAIRTVYIIAYYRTVIRDGIHLKPYLSADSSLRAIGLLAVRFTYLLVVVLIITAVMAIQDALHYGQAFGQRVSFFAAVCLVASIAFFLLLVFPTHVQMKKSKKELVRQLERHLGDLYEILRACWVGSRFDLSGPSPEAQVFLATHTVWDYSRGLCVWPFNFSILARYATCLTGLSVGLLSSLGRRTAVIAASTRIMETLETLLSG